MSLAKCNFVDAQAQTVTYPMSNRQAHSDSLDIHEKLIADGWEFLNQKMHGDDWVSTYIKLNN